VAQYFLEQAGFEVYLPKISYRRRYKGRRLTVLSPLFPGYLFTRIELQWRDVRLGPGVIKLSGEEHSTFPTKSSPRSASASATAAWRPGADRLRPARRTTRI
jgi:transcription antitermination factor NusG